MAGLLAANMLAERSPLVVEGQRKLPNNHHSLLRFRTPKVSDALNIPFKSVEVLKAVQPWTNPVADALSYSQKATGSISIRSIASVHGNMDVRWIAPPDLIERMARPLNVEYNHLVTRDLLREYHSDNVPIISTMPMPVLAGLLGYDFDIGTFKYRQGYTVTSDLRDSDAYCTVYVPNPKAPFHRVSITGDKLIAECCWPDPQPSGSDGDRYVADFTEEDLSAIGLHAAALMGIRDMHIIGFSVQWQRYAKILPIDDAARKRFILWATEEFGIYSLGRFATWRPGLLLDDVVNDVRVIGRLIDGSPGYEWRK